MAAAAQREESRRQAWLSVCRHRQFPREVYAAISPGKITDGAVEILHGQFIEAYPYLIECIYSDNGTEYKGLANHAFGVACYENGIGQKFTRVAHPQRNGKAERGNSEDYGNAVWKTGFWQPGTPAKGAVPICELL